MSNPNLEQIEIDIETAKNMIKTRDALALLRKNKYFKEVIEEGYFKHEMRRLVMLKGVALEENVEKSVNRMISGIGSLNNYFNEINRRGNTMEQELDSYEKTREEILAEDIE